MLRTLTRLAALSALTLTTAHAQSGCTALYATATSGSAATLDFVNTLTNTSSLVLDHTAAAGGTSINGAALNPTTGRVYYFDRTGTRNDLYIFDPVTRTTQFKAAVTPPNASNNINIGSTFDNSSGAPRLYVLYSNYAIQELNPDTGAVLRTITITYPSTDALGRSATRRRDTYNALITSGDIVFAGNQAYALLDGVSTGGNGNVPVVYWITLGALGAITTSTLTPPAAALRPIVDDAGYVVEQGSVNGAAITPTGDAYISASGNSNVPYLSRLLTTDPALVTATSPTANGARVYTDLSDCTVLPATPTITKTFSTSPSTTPPTIRTGQSATLTLNLTSANPSPSYTMAPVTDPLPTGIAVAATPNVTTTCLSSSGAAAPITATPGTTTVTIASGTRVPQTGTTCTVTLTVTGTTRGLKTNTIPAGSLQTTAGTYNTAATATLLVNDPITGTNVKRQRLYPGGVLTTSTISARPNDLVEYCITATHAGVGYAPATAATISDLLSSNLRFVTGSATQGYGAGRDLKITRNGGTPTYQTYGTTVSGQQLTFTITPFDSTNYTAEVCFIAQVK
ncbi:DUF7933 domain-containing protein [Deinococcus daejeonensis]|uniref:DUF7933 domain-containing protein n=1 Tax=Deinococcus daejeonensis TaxID=1007098 RepID=A0ABQ2J259_9DEIO|nr:hypothetical protein [Deinococcus daejeonensis]GGN38221.1 hypothetical protein GCM10010842_20870 [Deinococcus daejeonensis]